MRYATSVSRITCLRVSGCIKNEREGGFSYKSPGGVVSCTAEFIKVFKRYSQSDKVLGTYVGKRNELQEFEKGFLVHVRPDGRFHPWYFLFVGENDDDEEGGAVTGRLSCKKPA